VSIHLHRISRYCRGHDENTEVPEVDVFCHLPLVAGCSHSPRSCIIQCEQIAPRPTKVVQADAVATIRQDGIVGPRSLRLWDVRH